MKKNFLPRMNANKRKWKKGLASLFVAGMAPGLRTQCTASAFSAVLIAFVPPDRTAAGSNESGQRQPQRSCNPNFNLLHLRSFAFICG
jgi:hypothetical protein